MILEAPDNSLYLTTSIHEGQLPDFLERAISVADITAQKDMLLLSALTAASYALPNIRILHAKPQHVYSTNLISLIVAPPASGKGVMNNAERLLDPINDFLLLGDRSAIYSGDFSAASFVKTLAKNDGELFMIQTEMDKMGKNWGQAGNDFSDMFRQAFEHETIRYTRSVGPRRTIDITIKHPRISALLSGTLDQLRPFVGDGLNGLASRFLPYIVEEKIPFDPNVLGHGEQYEQNGVHAVYKTLSIDLFRRWRWLYGLENELRWNLTAEQSEVLGILFADMYNLAFEGLDMPDVFDATVKRMLVIILRIGAILSALRLDIGSPQPELLYCSDDDFRTLATLSEKLLRHAGRMILMLSQNDQKSNRVNDQKVIESNQKSNRVGPKSNRVNDKKVIEFGQKVIESDQKSNRVNDQKVIEFDRKVIESDQKSNRVNNQKVIEFGPKSNRVRLTLKQQKVLEFCDGKPRTAREIIEMVGVKYQTKTVEQYTTKLVLAGVLRPTTTNPNSPNRKYITVHDDE